jgi:hypothetical protein
MARQGSRGSSIYTPPAQPWQPDENTPFEFSEAADEAVNTQFERDGSANDRPRYTHENHTVEWTGTHWAVMLDGVELYTNPSESDLPETVGWMAETAEAPAPILNFIQE